MVIQRFTPLRTQKSPSRTALVFMPAASEPASGSERQYENIASPLASGPRYFFFSSSEPERITGSEPSLFTAGIREEEAQTRATSSITITVARASAPAPPYSSGTWTACRSEATRASSASCGKRASSSTAAANGAIFASASAADRLAEHVVLLGRAVQVEIGGTRQDLSLPRDANYR